MFFIRLHLGSVPRSIKDPVSTTDVNIGGFVKMLFASKEAEVKRFIYAASSSTYGDHPDLPKVEDKIGKPCLHMQLQNMLMNFLLQILLGTLWY